jgi:hypothetical protein
MITRRDLIGAGACAICGAARARAQASYNGCTLKTEEWNARTEPNPRALGFADDAGGRAVFGSGDPTFDRALAVTLVKISESFSVLPGFAFSERVKLNAFASANRSLGRDDGSVVFGKSLYRTIFGRHEHPEIGIVAVCAHEFGHIAQYKHGLKPRLVVNNRVKRMELHADFLAGYFAGRRRLESPDFPAAVFATTQYSFGDDSYGDPNHHGTSAERGQAVVAGFDCAYRAGESFASAIETGIRYVQQIPL